MSKQNNFRNKLPIFQAIISLRDSIDEMIFQIVQIGRRASGGARVAPPAAILCVFGSVARVSALPAAIVIPARA
jgi:hypothetical protein